VKKEKKSDRISFINTPPFLPIYETVVFGMIQHSFLLINNVCSTSLTNLSLYDCRHH